MSVYAMMSPFLRFGGWAHGLRIFRRAGAHTLKDTYHWRRGQTGSGREESNGRRGKPRSKRRFYLVLPLTKLLTDRFEHRFRVFVFFASFKLVIPLETL